MSSLKVLMGLTVLSLLSTACIRLEGQLDVRQPMAAKKKSGFLNLKKKEIKIEPDIYRAELKVNGSDSFTLKLEGREKILVPIKSEKDLRIPDNGIVRISAQDIGQPFDLRGNIATEVEHSPSTEAIEECSFTVTENRCQKICEKVDACKIECKDVQITLQGQHLVRYHFRTIHRDLSVDFLKTDKPEVLATFNGTDTQVDRIIDFSGQCR